MTRQWSDTTRRLGGPTFAVGTGRSVTPTAPGWRQRPRISGVRYVLGPIRGRPVAGPRERYRLRGGYVGAGVFGCATSAGYVNAVGARRRGGARGRAACAGAGCCVRAKVRYWRCGTCVRQRSGMRAQGTLRAEDGSWMPRTSAGVSSVVECVAPRSGCTPPVSRRAKVRSDAPR